MASSDWTSVWQRSRENWHWPQLPVPRLGRPTGSASTGSTANSTGGQYPLENYALTIDQDTLALGPLYLENLFDHLIVHYIFCPRSLETAGTLALAAAKGLRNPEKARCMVNIFSDIVVDSFRLERSAEDEEKVLLGWKRLAAWPEVSSTDRIVLGFLREFWSTNLPRCSRPEVELLGRVFSLGIRDRSLWPRQCQQTARILEPFLPGVLGRGRIRTAESLFGNAEGSPLTFASDLEPAAYQQTLSALGLRPDLARWYRDQSYSIEIRPTRKTRTGSYPSGPTKWRLTDPCSELDVAYSLSLSPRLIPGVTTYKREQETSLMAPGQEIVPDLLVVLDSSRSMEGHTLGTKTHKATLAAFKACQFAHSRGAEVAAISFSEKYRAVSWTRDLGSVEDVLVEFFCMRTSLPGEAILNLAGQRPGCLILCITDTHIQNLYQEWDNLLAASKFGEFVLFCIDQAYRDKHVEESLASLGKVYYINRLEDLISLVVETAKRAYGGESFISSK